MAGGGGGLSANKRQWIDEDVWRRSSDGVFFCFLDFFVSFSVMNGSQGTVAEKAVGVVGR